MEYSLIKEFLDEKEMQYNSPEFIDTDPICIPHRFKRKEDIEIAGFLTATIAWGKRSMIIKNALQMMELMDDAPYDFVMNASENELKYMKSFKHRTFNGEDMRFFILRSKDIYQEYSSLENALLQYPSNLALSISRFKEIFMQNNTAHRSQKHISNPMKNSAAKRINMYLRWMVRKDKTGVDFGLWNKISMSELKIPLDVHSGNTARKLGLLKRKQNDWKAVEELTEILKSFDANDPVKYDYALFGLGVFEKF
ncbi:MAG TPA: TIGR02757 family protein [Flavobacteriales bacterium]|nr:TIGR02757 family protein [Flavobacteriales bacterium]